METNCFARDLNGTEIVNLPKSLQSHNFILDIHKGVNFFVCSSAIFLNVLLGTIIVKTNAEMFRMRTIIWFGLSVDLISSVLNLIASPIANWSHNRWIAINNSPLQITNVFANSVLMSFVCMFTLFSWTVIPFQFAYRLYLVKYGDRPRGLKLFIFVFTLTVILLLAILGSFNLYTNNEDFKFLREAQNILQHAGYTVPMYNVHGATVYDERMKTWNSYVLFNTLIGYAVVIFCSLKIRNIVRGAAMSKVTRRMNEDIDKVLFSLALVPIFMSLLPSFCGMYSLSRCELWPIMNFLVSLSFAVAPLINPFMTIYFIRPYRLTLIRWLHLEKVFASQFVTSVQSISGQVNGGNITHISKTISAVDAGESRVNTISS